MLIGKIGYDFTEMNNMKKFIIISLLLFPFFSHASFTKDLYYGVRGDAEVQALQEFLADQGHYTGTATGNFFSLTLSAVKKFQIANNILPVSGYVGSKTRAKINDLSASSAKTKPVVIQGEPTPQPLSSSAPNIKLGIPQNPAPQMQVQTQENTTLKIAKCQADTQTQFNAFINETYQYIDDTTSVRIAAFKEQIRQIINQGLNNAGAVYADPMVSNASRGALLGSGIDLANNNAAIDYDKVAIQQLESQAIQLKGKARLAGEQVHSASYRECLKK